MLCVKSLESEISDRFTGRLRVYITYCGEDGHVGPLNRQSFEIDHLREIEFVGKHRHIRLESIDEEWRLLNRNADLNDKFDVVFF